MKGLTSYHLKLLAAASMLIDHIGVIFYPETDWLRMIGRISFPLFVWLLVQGEAHTRDVWQYGLRLGLLGFISQPVYQLAFDTERLNILFQLLIGLIGLRLARHWPGMEILIWLISAAITELLDISYGSYGIILILLTRYFRPTVVWVLAWVGFHLIWAEVAGPFQLPAAIVPLFFYWANSQRGAKARWFYGFYPGHLALLIGIRMALS